jgi:hypothetical protein
MAWQVAQMGKKEGTGILENDHLEHRERQERLTPVRILGK